MSTTTTHTRQALPTGTWQLDPVHSTVGFGIEYMVGAFRGQFRDVEATLGVDGEAAVLEGAARVESVDAKDETLAAHLLSPEFFDSERFPELRFASREIVRDGQELAVRGEIAIKGVTQPIELTGTITEGVVDPYGRNRIGLNLTGTVDRTTFGLDWNLPLPSGEPALANEVTIQAELFFVEQA